MKHKNKIRKRSVVSIPAVQAVVTHRRTPADTRVQITRDAFWNTVEKVKGHEGCPEVLLAAALGGHTLPELISFRDHFDGLVDEANQQKLWAAADLIGRGCLDDGFEYFRYGLIAKGRNVFEAAVKHPDSLADADVTRHMGNEIFGYVAGWVYEMLTGGQPMPDNNSRHFRREPIGNGPEFGDTKAYRRRFPKLWAKFGKQYE